MNMRFAVFILLALAQSALADCPAAPDHVGAVDDLLAETREAGSEAEARVSANKLWELWTDAPDEIAQAMLDRGMARRRGADFLGALTDLDRLVDYCPEYAEGYNQRAFVNFLRRDYVPALADLNRTLELAPNHVAALSGKALTLLGMGQVEDARTTLEKALALNPWLPERRLAAQSGPLAPPGEDI